MKEEDELVPTRIVEYFGRSKFTRDEKLAKEIASRMTKRYTPEYGIAEIAINKTWDQIVKEAKELARLELDTLVKRSKWGRDIIRLYNMSRIRIMNKDRVKEKTNEKSVDGKSTETVS